MNDLQIFKSEEFGEVRTVEIDGEVWFVGKDVTDSLGYANSRDALSRHVDEEDKQVSGITTEAQSYNMTVINESGVHSLVFGSQLPNAKRYKHWITAEVLPSIRKTGSYSVNQLPQNLQIAQLLINQIAEQQKQIEKVETTIDNVKQAILPVTDNWREETNKKVTRICQACGDAYREVRTEMYKLLEQRAGCDLNRRVQNLRYRMSESGATKTQINAINKLVVIEQDKKLSEIFSKIVSEYEIRYCA